MNGRKGTFCFRLVTLALAMSVGWATVSQAASGCWNGTQNAVWTNSANWSALPYPSGNDTASFTNAGNGNTTIDLTGLSTIKAITFDTGTVAAHTIGSGGVGAQTLTVVTSGQIGLTSSVGVDQTFAATVQLPGDYTFANSAPARTLAFNGVTCTGSSALTLNNTGPLSFLGNLSRNGLTFNINQNGTNAVLLSGANNQVTMWTFNGVNAVLNLAAGSVTTFNGGGGNNLLVTQDAVINGPGVMVLSTAGGENFADNCVANGKTLTVNAKLTGATGFEYWNDTRFGTIALYGQNDFTLNVIMNAAGTIAVTNVGNQASTTSNLGAGSRFIFNSTYGGASCLKYLGVGEDTDRCLEFRKDGIVDQSGPSGALKFTTAVISSGGLTMTLRGSTAGTGEIAGVVPSSTSVAKSGTGTWYLSASNTYSGATTVNAGNLVIAGTNASVRSTSGITLNGGVFVLLNTATSNLTDRLSDSAALTLSGGTFCFSNDLSAASFSETVGAVIANSGASTLAVTPAAGGQTASLRLASVMRNAGASVNFVGEGLGDSDRARVFITGQGDGLIGTWATVNGTRYAAYSSTRGVYAAPLAVDIAARGVSVITNDATLAVRISYPGEAGPIALETSPVSSVGSLTQNSDTPAVVTTTNTLFKLSEIIVGAGKASLTVGAQPREGTLSTISAGGRLSLENNSASGALTINAGVVMNTTTGSLVKTGAGKVLLAGENTYSGATAVVQGELAFGPGNHAIGQLMVNTASFVVTNAAASYIYVASNSAYIGQNAGDVGRMTLGGNAAWSGFLYPKYSGQTTLNVGNSGQGLLTLQDSASITQRLYVGNNTGSAGAVYQNGGVMHNWGGGSSDPRIGAYGYGYYELNGGTFTNMGWTQIGYIQYAIGILRQSGGAFKFGTVYDGNLGISRGGTGVVYVSGGTFVSSSTIDVGEQWDNNATNGFAELTVAGGRADINGDLYMADRFGSLATVNLNGGTLAVNRFVRAGRPNATALVNFNGGTFQARASGNLFGTGTNAPSAVTVFSRGATVDTTNLACTVPVPLVAPTGSGVASIGVTTRAGYIGPPMVTIAGGGGTGATAVARFDSASGSVTGIDVTSPGFGYTSTPAVSLSGGGTNVQTAVGPASLSANVSGGLTKIGSGTLILSATNTYAGATTVSNGTLRLGVVLALPTNSVVALAGGALDCGGLAQVLGVVNVTGGSDSLLNGSLACGSVAQTGGTLGVGAALGVSQTINVDGGVLKLTPVQAGLYEGPLSLNFNTWDSLSSNVLVQLTTRMANINAKPPWTDNITYLYSGYLWNRTGTNATWTFAENVDDNAMLKIDGATVLNDGGWATPTKANITLTPGAHVFEARFGNGGGGAGLVDGNGSSSLSWWKTNALGFGVDYLGRNETNVANYVALTDPGDGSRLTLTPVSGGFTNRISVSSSVVLGATGVLDLSTNLQSQTLASLGGSGIVSNGVLAVTGAIAPGGTNAIGTLTVANNYGLSGKLLVDVAADGSSASDKLAVIGNMNLSLLQLEVANPAQMKHGVIYTVMTVSGTSTGAFSAASLPDRWLVRYRTDGRVVLLYPNGTLIKLF